MGWIDRLATRQIDAAQRAGKLDKLAGEGKPLPERKAAPGESETDAILYGVMASAGVVPPEVELRKALAEKRAALAKITDPDEQKLAMAEVAKLDLRLNIAMEARRR